MSQVAWSLSLGRVCVLVVGISALSLISFLALLSVAAMAGDDGVVAVRVLALASATRGQSRVARIQFCFDS
jgi:hypothetical protein